MLYDSLLLARPQAFDLQTELNNHLAEEMEGKVQDEKQTLDLNALKS